MNIVSWLAAFIFAVAAVMDNPSIPQVSSVAVPSAEIKADNARWTALGVKLPPPGIVEPRPYGTPYSARSFVVPWAWYQSFYQQLHDEDDAQVRASDLRADLPLLQFLMQRTYAGYETAASKGWNWNDWFESWDRHLGEYGDRSLTLHEAFDPWGNLETFQLDNHSGVASLQDFISGSVSALLSGKPAGACTDLRMDSGSQRQLHVHDLGQQPHEVHGWSGSTWYNATYISYPARDGVAASITCAGRAIAVHDVSTRATASNRENVLYLSGTPSYKLLGSRIALVRLPTFTVANDNAITRLLNNQAGVGTEKAVIFDLRGNEGGNAPTSILKHWISADALRSASGSHEQVSSDSCFANALYFNLQEQLSANLSPPVNAQTRAFLQSMVDSLDYPNNNDCQVKPSITTKGPALKDHVFETSTPVSRTRLIALVDNGCGSDCEYFTKVVAALPGSVIAGTSTYGVMGFTQPGYFVLPHSRVVFRLALSRTDNYGDSRSVDGYGIAVDVLLATTDAESDASLYKLAQALLR